MANIEANEVIFSKGSQLSGSDFLKWFSTKQIYTSGQTIDLANLGISNEFVTPNGCIGYKLSIRPIGNTGGGSHYIMTVNGTRIEFILNNTGALYSPYFYESPMHPYVEIKDALEFENQTGVAITIGIIYYRLKYRDR